MLGSAVIMVKVFLVSFKNEFNKENMKTTGLCTKRVFTQENNYQQVKMRLMKFIRL